MKHIITITDKDITGADTLSSAKPRIAVNAVLFDVDSNIALSYRRDFNLYTLPGGGVEVDEDLHEAVKREIWEETGCDCEIIGELGQIIENRAEFDFTQERYYYIAQVLGEKGVLHLTDAEIAADTTVVWFSPEQAFKIISEGQHERYQHKFIQKRDIAAFTEVFIWIYTHDIPSRDTFTKIEQINKGFSQDKKYYIETLSGEKLLLRISDISEYEFKKSEFEMLKRAADFGILTNKPVDFGVCNDGKNVYQLLKWLDGKDVKSVLPNLNEREQYTLGIKSGELLRKIHGLPAPENVESWGIRFRRKMEHCINIYNSNDFKSQHVEPIIKYLYDNLDLIDSRPQTFIHGDFWVANLIADSNGEVGVIDFTFNDSGYGDPWFELGYTMPWEGEVFHSHFFIALFKGYFGGEPPHEFFQMIKYYYGSNALGALCDIAESQDSKREQHIKSFENVVKCFGDFTNDVPSWYLKDLHM